MLQLRPYIPADASAIVRWVGDERAFRQWSADRYDRYPISPEDINAQYAAPAAAGILHPFTATDGDGPAGHLIMRFTDEARTVLRFGFVIVDAAKRCRGYGREMLRLALETAFVRFGASAVTLGVFENNPAAWACYSAAGFRDVQTEKTQTYRVLGEEWKCREMKIDAAQWRQAAGAAKREIVTPRLRLAAIRPQDREALLALMEDPVVSSTYLVPALDTEEKKEALFRRLMALSAAPDRYVYGMFRADRLIGLIHEVSRAEGTVEVGYAVCPAGQNRGYATEALQALAELLFRAGFGEVKAGAFEENGASRRVMEKCGMEQTGECETIAYRGQDHRCVYYALRAAGKK